MKAKVISTLLTAALLVTAVPAGVSADTTDTKTAAESVTTESAAAEDETVSSDASAASEAESTVEESAASESSSTSSTETTDSDDDSSSTEATPSRTDLASRIAEARQGVADGDPQAQEALDELLAESDGLVGARCDTLGGTGLQHSSAHAGMQQRYGVDVSKWDGNIDWAKLKAEGVTFAFIRLGYRSSGNGAIMQDPTGITNVRNALANGIPVGVYIFSQAVSTDEARQEADALAGWANGYNISLPYVMDYEYANGRLSRSIPVSTKTACVNAFTEEMKRLGHTPALYADADYLKDDLTMSQVSGDCTVWMAHWNTNPAYKGN